MIFFLPSRVEQILEALLVVVVVVVVVAAARTLSRSPLAHFPIDSRRSLFLTRMPLNVCIAFDIIMCVHSFLTLYAHGPLMLKRSRGHSEVLELKRQMAVKVSLGPMKSRTKIRGVYTTRRTMATWRGSGS